MIPLSGLHPPVHAPVRKDVLEDGKKEFETGYALLLVRAAAGEQFCDAESPHVRRNCLGGLNFVRILCYNGHGTNLSSGMVVWSLPLYQIFGVCATFSLIRPYGDSVLVGWGCGKFELL